MKKIFVFVVAAVIVLSSSISLAAERIIEASGEYVMDSRLDETPASATARAREEAKRSAVDKAGVYVETYSKMVDMTLEEDEVRTVAANLLKIQDESSGVEVIEKNLLKFKVTIKALVEEVDEKTLKKMMGDKQTMAELIRQNKELAEKYDALNRQMAKYRGEFDSASDAGKAEIKRGVARNSERFSAVEEFDKGNKFSFRKEYSKALAAYDAAIKMDPQLAEAYNNRGVVKYELGQFKAATDDYTTAIKLKSNYADALNNRGNAYAALEQYKDAEKDLKAALKLNDKSAAAHNNLGSVYLSQRNFEQAINEYNRALQLNPNFAEAYYNRAVTYYSQGNYAQALYDAQKAVQLNPDNARELYEKIRRQFIL